jgi:hypothetical protein
MSAGEHAITGFRDFNVGFGEKIADLSDFFENTRYCGKTCNKIAYMLKFGREQGMRCPIFSCKGLLQSASQPTAQILFF